jgi:hypothetical protein
VRSYNPHRLLTLIGLHVLSYFLCTLSEVGQVCEDVIELTLWLIKEMIVIDSKRIQTISPSNKVSNY